MLKNITLSVEEILIKKAREVAGKEGKTLNAAFREWLQRYASRDGMASDYQELMDNLHYAQPGRKFGRDEMNER